MFGTIRKHQKWLWGFLVAVMSISLVAFFSSDTAFKGGRDPRNFGTINGRPISREQRLDAYRESRLRHLFNYGNWPDRDERNRQRNVNLEQDTMFRLLLAQKIQELNVQVSDAAVAEWIANSPAFQDRDDRTFRKEAYDRFVRQVLPEGGVTEADFERFVRHEIGIHQLTALFGASGGLVTSREAETLYRQENEQLVTEVVPFSFTNFYLQVTINPTNLAQFYSNRLAVYRLPERVQVSYVKFDVTNFLAEADQKLNAGTNLNAVLESIYQQRGPKFFTDTNNLPLSPEAAKEQIKKEVLQNQAMLGARKKAAEFGVELDEMKPQEPANLMKLAATRGHPVQDSGPFSEFEIPDGLKVLENFSRQAFTLNAEEPFRGPIEGVDGVYVITLKKKIPSEVPPLESVLQKVMDDYRHQQALELAWQAGRQFHDAASRALAQGKSFPDACTETNVVPLKVPPFSMSTRSLPEVENVVGLFDLQNVAQGLALGKLSSFNPTREGGFVVFLQARQPVKEEQVKAALPDYLSRLRQARRFEAFREWLRIAIETARPSGLGGAGTEN